MPQRNDLRTEAIHTGEHRRIGARSRNMRTVTSLKECSTLGEPIDMRRSEMMVAVTAHVIGSQGINPDEHDVGLLCHGNLRRADAPLLFSVLILAVKSCCSISGCSPRFSCDPPSNKRER